MQKRVLCFWLTCFGISVIVESAFAKVWLLPDYQEKELFSNRSNELGDDEKSNNPGIENSSCSSYGGISSSNLPSGHICENPFYVGRTRCCKSSSCAPSYKYTSKDCSDNGKITGGNSCKKDEEEFFTECKCDTTKYPDSSTLCVPSLSGASCSDNDGVHYEKCVEDPCAGKEAVTCPKALECAEWCGGNCIRCNPQPDCDSGYHWNDDLGCTINACQEGFAVASNMENSCGMAISNSHWELGSEVNGQVGNEICYNCVLTCDEGYADYDTYWCDVTLQTTDCKTLGYSTGGDCFSGTTKVFCPFDSAYFTCIAF